MIDTPSNPSARGNDPRWAIAEQVATAILKRWPAEIRALGVRGALAHDGEREGGEVDLVAVTYRDGGGPPADVRRIDGHIVRVEVASAETLLARARTLDERWPLTADHVLSFVAMHDESRVLDDVRDAHLARLAEASGREFAALARGAWCVAAAHLDRSTALSEWFDTDGALLALAEARLQCAVTDGLLTRTHFVSSADAVRRTGLGDADRAAVRERLDSQAADLERRGQAVDTTIDGLLG